MAGSYDKSILVLLEGLAKNTTLLELNISDNHLEDEGGRALTEFLRANQSLTHLNIDHNAFGITTWQCLKSALLKRSVLPIIDYPAKDMEKLQSILSEPKRERLRNILFELRESVRPPVVLRNLEPETTPSITLQQLAYVPEALLIVTAKTAAPEVKPEEVSLEDLSSTYRTSTLFAPVISTSSGSTDEEPKSEEKVEKHDSDSPLFGKATTSKKRGGSISAGGYRADSNGSSTPPVPSRTEPPPLVPSRTESKLPLPPKLEPPVVPARRDSSNGAPTPPTRQNVPPPPSRDGVPTPPSRDGPPVLPSRD